jgi:hypothetical protein
MTAAAPASRGNDIVGDIKGDGSITFGWGR